MSIETETSDSSPQSEKRRPFQFNLKAILVVMAIVGVLCVPGATNSIGYFYFASVPSILGITIWKGRGWVRPFAICAFVPHISVVCQILFRHFEYRPEFIGNMFDGSIAGISGAVCFCYLQRVNGLVPVPNLPFIRSWLSNNDGT